MRLATASAVLALSLSMTVSPASARHASHEDNKLNYKDCEGRNLTARWDSSNTSLLANFPGTAADPNKGGEIKYLAWDGTCRALAWDLQARQFVHTFDGKQESSPIVNYVTWDDAKWSAMRQGTGFYHVLVADRDDQQPASRVKEAAEWLERTKGASQAARNMVRLLNATAP